MKTLTEKDVRYVVADTINDLIEDFKDEPDIDREAVIDRLDEECDTIFGQLVMLGRIDHYTVDDMIATAGPCATILQVAQADAWIEDDHGLWEGLTYGIIASIAFFSLRNLLYARLKHEGYDTNEDRPFNRDEDSRLYDRKED